MKRLPHIILLIFLCMFVTGARNQVHAASFVDETSTYGISASDSTSLMGASWVDVDKDGDYDLFLPGRLYLNNGTGAAMTDATSTYGISSASGRSNHWIDIDNDGDMDLYSVVDGAADSNKLFINNGAGVAMTDATATYGIGGSAVNDLVGSWIDIDNDGDLDLYLTSGLLTGGGNTLYINNGSGAAMTNATATYGLSIGEGWYPSTVWGDIDNDGDLDLFILEYNSTNKLYINNGPGVAFTDKTSTYGVAGISNVLDRSASLIDIDNDGDLDIFEGQYTGANKLYINNGPDTTMTEASATYGLNLSGTNFIPGWGDINADGNLDVNITRISGGIFLQGAGAGSAFTNQTSTYGLTNSHNNENELAFFDFDNDGDQDAYFSKSGAANILLTNPGQGNNYLKVFVNNSSGVYQYHARVEIDIDGDNDFSFAETARMQYQTASSNGGVGVINGDQDPAGLYFGLGSSSVCTYDVRVFLPGVDPDDTPSFSEENVCPNQTLTFPAADTAPTPISVTIAAQRDTASISWSTRESSSTQIEYGATTSYGSTTTETDTSPRVTSHAVTLSGLTSCRTYYYRLISKDASGTQGTATGSFKTSGCVAGSPLGSAGSGIVQQSGGNISTGNVLAIVDAGTTDFHITLEPDIRKKDNPIYFSGWWQISGSYTLWFKDYYNGANVLPELQNKPSIISLRYEDTDLLFSGGGFPEESLRLAFSPDGISWKILPTSVVDTINNTVAALHKPQGYYMIVGTFTQSYRVPSTYAFTPAEEVDKNEATEDIAQDAKKEMEKKRAAENNPSSDESTTEAGKPVSLIDKVFQFIKKIF